MLAGPDDVRDGGFPLPENPEPLAPPDSSALLGPVSDRIAPGSGGGASTRVDQDQVPPPVAPESCEVELSVEQVAAIRTRALSDFYFFAKGILQYDKLSAPVHLPLCRLLQDFTKNNKLIVLPRGWFKTTVVSIAYSIWRAVRNTNERILIVQNTYTNAMAKLSAIKTQFETNGLLRKIFPEVLPDATCTWKANSLCLKRTRVVAESTFECAGIRTAVVSRHYTIIIEDDTVAPDLDEIGADNIIPTKEDIEKAIGWHKLGFALLDNPSSDENIVVGTRWFEHDLISFVKANEKSYFKYERACRENVAGLPDPMGQATFVERFPENVLLLIEEKLGPYLFSCLYMNLPVSSKKMLFQQAWFKYYETLPSRYVSFVTVDPAGDPEDAKGDPDFTVVMTCVRDLYTQDIYVVEYFHEKCTPGEMLDEIFRQVRMWKPVNVGVEAVAYQRTILYYCRQRMIQDKIWFMLTPINNSGRSKNARIMGLQPLFANGMIKLKAHMRELMNEILVFPLGKNDDLVDCLAMQLEIIRAMPVRVDEEERVGGGDPLDFETAISEIRARSEPTGGVLYKGLKISLGTNALSFEPGRN